MQEYQFKDEKTIEAIADRLEDEVDNDDFKEVANTFRVLGDLKRLKIIAFLHDQGDLCVYEIAKLLDASIATTSHHLMILRNQGLIQCVKQGKHVIYSLNDDRVLRLIAIAEQINAEQLAGIYR
ncbi:transcriptional regulator [Suicoccus acidiformans]|uniref:Transcriptional regulator n=1 Tax=Suicoccus acidiformans TaxID=2036206 RepID=A0A347WNG0_9LACT|nr:metalloregulator ArsR/SmtB family transcription factor [Suicoccus acidiformans]AXY26617.1 transcriptional regulator [Suicoccus acidiformans]